MKKILFIVLMVLCLSGVVNAVEYLDSSVTIVDQMRINLNLAHTTVTATDSVCLGYVYEGAMAVSVFIQGRLLVDTVVTTVYDHIIAFDTLMEIVDDVDFFSADSLKQVEWKDRDDWDELEAVETYLKNISTFPERLPTHYDWERGYLFLHPVPGHSGDSIVIVGYAKPDDMVADSEFVQDILVLHRPAILYYATSMLALRLGRTVEAQVWESKYDKYVAPLVAIRQKMLEASPE